MAMPLDYSRNHVRPFAAVSPVIDATDSFSAIKQVQDFMSRNTKFTLAVPNTSFFPFSAICALQITFPGGSGGGTGFYIDSDLILTCGHNLFHPTLGRATSVRVRPGQQDASTWLDSFVVTPDQWSVHLRWDSSGATDVAFDLAVIRVSPSAPNMEYFELINYCPAEDEPVAVCGYSSVDVDGTRQHLDIDKTRKITPDLEMIEYNLQTRAGGSGSPIFAHYPNHDAGSYLPSSIPVMGVHTRGSDGQYNKGVLLTPDKIDWIKGRGNTSVSSFSMSRRTGRSLSGLGGLPLLRPDRRTLGGLPLAGRTGQQMARQQSWARQMDRAWIVIDQGASGGMSVAKRTFGHPTHDMTGKTTLSVRVPNIPAGGSILWNVPAADHKGRVVFETGSSTSHSASGTSVTLRSTAGGPAAVDCMVKDASGTTVESNKYWMSSPQFILVAIHPSTDTFFDGIGMSSRKTAIYAEMAATMRHLYRNVNVRFVFPGDTLPLHLGLASNPDFPGGIKALPSVQYAEVIGDDTVMDPEETLSRGTPTPYGARSHGRNHEPGDLPAPMDQHALARGLIHHFANTRAPIGHVQTEAAAGRLSATDMDLAATMYGRLIGENLSHEVGHFLANAFVPHTTSGLMEDGGDRSTPERTGMTVQTTAPVLTDNGRGTINELPAAILKTFEAFLPINPPIDHAAEVTRGGVGSFALGRSRGWVNRPVGRSLSETTVHLPGGTVLDGWKAEAFAMAIEVAFKSVLSTNPMFFAISPFVSVDVILAACDRFGITLCVGVSGAWGIGAGVGGGAGLIFAPGHRIGFYGTGGGLVGHIYSLSGGIQVTLINGGPEVMSGDGYVINLDVSTVGWFTADVVDVPVGLQAVFDANRNPIGVSFGVSISTGIPIISLIELYAQSTKTATTMGYRRSRSLNTISSSGTAYDAALQEAIANGASPAEAEAFLAPLFG